MAKLSSWLHFCFIFIATALTIGVLLPLVRSEPARVHAYVCSLAPWVRSCVVFALCVLLTALQFRLLSPRAGQLRKCHLRPPAWLAVLIAWIVAAIIDIFGGFAPNGYRASPWEWLWYGLSSVVVVSGYRSLISEGSQEAKKRKPSPVGTERCGTFQDLEKAPWEDIEKWLSDDAPAQYDFLGGHAVAHRVGLLIAEGVRSVGIVGPFGAGKTSIVEWIKSRLEKSETAGEPVFFICQKSCWGFETSGSAINEILSSAVLKLNSAIDTFQFDSLPENYRRTFSAAGDWAKTLSNLLLHSSSPEKQFRQISNLLSEINGRLVLIVEDLDRSDTRSFEIQEILAFLERLKTYPNFSFILTGGLSSTQRIDYVKLCDHIEFLGTIQPQNSSKLIDRVRERCLNSAHFPHVRLSDPERDHLWHPLSGMLMREHDEFSLPLAVTWLLNTPRSLRHALGHTFSAWRTIHGEIDFDDLLAVNILRFGAPESFQFLMRRWDRLKSPPPQNPSFGQERIDRIRGKILDDWNRTIQDVEWNPDAALKVIKFILPAAEYWLIDDSHRDQGQPRSQQVTEERYWRRAVNEAIDREDVRDQDVVHDIQAWLNTPNVESELVTKLTSFPRYGDVWETLAVRFFADRRKDILLLCEQVIRRILCEHANSAGRGYPGFDNLWRYACRYSVCHQDNRGWMQDRISEAAQVSIEMANALWHCYGDPGRYSILRLDDATPVRQHMLDTLRSVVVDGPSLVAKLSPNASASLYQLVFDPGNEGPPLLADPPTWAWLGTPILEALRSRNWITAANCVVLLGTRFSSQDKPVVDIEALDSFFGNDAAEVVDLLEEMVDQLPPDDRGLALNVIAGARQQIHSRSAIADGLPTNG